MHRPDPGQGCTGSAKFPKDAGFAIVVGLCLANATEEAYRRAETSRQEEASRHERRNSEESAQPATDPVMVADHQTKNSAETAECS